MADKITYETNDKWTKKDTVCTIILTAVILGLIGVTFFIGNTFGIPEFQIH